MTEAWIYGTRDADSTARLLAELGFSPHRVVPNGSLRPSGGGDRAPKLAVVLPSEEPGEPSSADMCSRLAAEEDRDEVLVLVAVDPDELSSGAGVAEGHELLVTPFGLEELRARIARARLAVNGVDHDDVVRVAGLELDLATYQVTVGGRPADFTYMEYELLKFLVTHPRRAFTREALLARVWGYDYYGAPARSTCTCGACGPSSAPSWPPASRPWAASATAGRTGEIAATATAPAV